MPITQQLARLDEGLVERCRRDARLVDDLCSFRLLQPDAHLDLDWSPAVLEAAALVSRISPGRRSTLALATAGEHELNPAYRDLAGSIWQHPVTVNPADRVVEVHSALQALADDGFPSAEAARAAVAQLGGVSSTDAPDYLAKQFAALDEFYAVAAARRLHTVMWWD